MHSSQMPLSRHSSNENCERNEETVDPLDDAASKCEDILREMYKKVLSRIQPLSWWENSLQLDDVYTELELETRKGSHDFERSELFNANIDCDNPRRILLEGDPGYGKSTFCLKLAYDWARDRVETFRDYRLVFLFNLRQCQGKLEDFIFENLLPKDCQIDRGSLMEFVRRNQDKIVLLLDGWDEMICSANDDIGKLLEGRILRHCKVLLTSRKIHADDNNENAQTAALRKSRAHFDRLLSIRGFSPSSLKDFIHRHFVATEQTQEDAGKLIQQIETSENKQTILSLMACPMNALLMCDVWAESGSMLIKITPLYDRILQLIVKRYREKYDERQITIEDVDRQFIFLGKLAVDIFLADRVKFDKSDLHLQENEDILRMGFLTRYLDSRLLSSDPRASFVIHHKTFQEFFAAKYIASFSETEPENVETIAKRFSVRMTTSECQTLFRFLAGHLNQKSYLIFNFFQFNDLEFVSQCLMETDATESLIRSAVKYIKWDRNITVSLDAEQTLMKDIIERLLSTLPFKPRPLDLSLKAQRGECLANFKLLLQILKSKEIPLSLSITFENTYSDNLTKNAPTLTRCPQNDEENTGKTISVAKTDVRSSECVSTTRSEDFAQLFSLIDECGVGKLINTLSITCCLVEASVLHSLFRDRKKIGSLEIFAIHGHDTCLPTFIDCFWREKVGKHMSLGFSFWKTFGVHMSSTYDPALYADSQCQFIFQDSDFKPYEDSLVQYVNLSDVEMYVQVNRCNMSQCDYIDFCKKLKNTKIVSLCMNHPIGDNNDYVRLNRFQEFVDVICNMKHLDSLSISGWRFPGKHSNPEMWEAAWRKLFIKLEYVSLGKCLPSDRSTHDVEPHAMIKGLCLAKADSIRLRKVTLIGNTLNNGEISELGRANLIYNDFGNFDLDLRECRVSTVSGVILQDNFSRGSMDVVD